MKSSTIYLTLAGVLTVVAVPLLYIGGKQGSSPIFLAIGFTSFGIGMIIAPIMRVGRIFQNRSAKSSKRVSA